MLITLSDHCPALPVGCVRSSQASRIGGTTALALIVPAAVYAATTGATTVTFTITAGALDITVPAAASIGRGSTGGSITGQMGAVTVTDTRAALTATWTTTVSSTDFTTGGGTTAETIPKAAVSY